MGNLASGTIDSPFTSTRLAPFGQRKFWRCSEGDVGWFTSTFILWQYGESMGWEWEREGVVVAL